jgi:Terminase large subunit, T4likevirus-type, N-terminal
MITFDAQSRLDSAANMLQQAYGESIPRHHLMEVLWRRGELSFLLWKQQEPIWSLLDSLPPHIVEFVVLCARQFGKSTFGVLRALSRALKKRDRCILIIGPDVKQTKDIVNPKMRFLTRSAPPGLIRQAKAENRWFVHHDLNARGSDYSEIIIGGMNENASSQRGKTVEEILIEEIADVNEDQYLESIESDLGPSLTHSDQGRILFLTTLPLVPDHPFITQTMVKAELNGALARFTIDDNVALSPDQYEACVTRCGGKHTDAFKREYLCEVVRLRSRVCVPDFEELRNVREFSLPISSRYHVTIDWGGVRDKTVAVLHTYDYFQDIDLFIDERVFEPNTPTSQIIGELRSMESEWLREGRIAVESRYIDAPPQLVSVDLVKDYGYHASLPVKMDWTAALNTLNVRFGLGKALIHPRCKFLIQSARSGILNKLRTDYDRNEALGHMDGVAAMKYAVRMRNQESPYRSMYDAVPREEIILENSHMPEMRSVVPPQDLIQVNPLLSGPRVFGKFRTGR